MASAPWTHVCVEHWTATIEQARAAAFNIIHLDSLRPFSPGEYIWSDQHGWRFQFAGRTGGKSHLIIRDPVEESRFAVLYSGDDELYGDAMIANWPKALILAR